MLVVVVCFAIGLVYEYEIEQFYFRYLTVWMVTVLLILVHELGHALTSRLVDAKVHGIYVRWMSGLCYTDGFNSRLA